jgi:type IV pilus assembly protein PilF
MSVKHPFSFILLLQCSLLIQACSTIDTSANVNLGLAYLEQNKPELAKYRLLLALEQAPGDDIVQDAFAYYLEKTGAFAQAKQHYLLAIHIAKHSGAAKNNYGTFLCRRGQYTEAIQYFLAASQDLYYLNTANAYENAGLCALKIPATKQAKEYFAKALAINPSRTRSLSNLAKIR